MITYSATLDVPTDTATLSLIGVVTGLLGERGPGTPTPFSRLAPGDTVEL